jgi:hypothetical protein
MTLAPKKAVGVWKVALDAVKGPYKAERVTIMLRVALPMSTSSNLRQQRGQHNIRPEPNSQLRYHQVSFALSPTTPIEIEK